MVETASRQGPVPTRRRRPIVRVLMAVAAAAATWHIVATFLWVAPPSPARDLVPGSALSAYMLPLFGQSWSVFAPEPVNGDNTFAVRAVVDDGDGPASTDWVSATDAEVALIQHTLAPPRAGIQATILAGELRKAHGALEDEGQRIASLNYFESAWDERLASHLTEADDAAAAFLAVDADATAYATQVARAVWGDDVVRVQYQVARQNVIPFELRHDETAERETPRAVDTGWRGTLVRDGQRSEPFERMFADVRDAQAEARR